MKNADIDRDGMKTNLGRAASARKKPRAGMTIGTACATSAACGFTALALLAGCASAPPRQGASAATYYHSVGNLRFIGEQRIALKQQFHDTTLGGLSGIDYDPKTDSWVMESDDRSAVNPARFYTAHLSYDDKQFASVTLTGVNFFRQADGSTYPGTAQFPTLGGEVPDIETIRVDPQDGSIWYGSEGDRKRGLDPFIKHANRDGDYLATLPMPAMFKIWPQRELGPRDNMSFEGLSFTPDGKSLWVGMETALYQDGPISTPTNGALARMTHMDRAGHVLGQFIYPIESIPAAPAPGKFADNGVSEILAINDHQLFAIERSGVEAADGTFRNFVRLYEMDVSDATDVSHLESIKGAAYVPARKRLVLNLNALGLRIDNLEGIAWGPKLPNGHDSLVMVSDDNFNPKQVTQFLLFDVQPQ
jgi:hypothetical protein